MLSNLKIRSKLVAILAPLVVALVVLASIGATQRHSTANRSHRDTQVIKLAQLQATVAHELELEGALTVQVLAGDTTAAGPLKAQRAATDKATSALLKEYDSFGKSLRNAQTETAIASSRQRLDGISPQREQVDTKGESWDIASQFYISSATTMLEGNKNLIAETTTPEVVSSLQSFYALSTFKAQLANSGSIAVGTVLQGRWYDAATLAADGSAGGDTGTAVQDAQTKFTRAKSDEKVASQVLQSNSSAELGEAINLVGGPEVSELSSISDQSLVNQVDNHADLNDLPADITAFRDRIGKDLTATINRYRTVEVDYGNKLLSNTKKLQANAERASQWFILFAGLIVAAAVALAVVVARSITRPINHLTSAAHKLSREQLPRLVDSLKNPAEDDVGYLANTFTPIEVSGKDEVGQLADAFNGIQSVAVNVATEQASLLRKGIGDMFINLARRNQTLLDRQIEFIDQLESKEEDPDQLENLFRLDHLATRMRRNAESLLVLAGAEPNRRRGKPVPLADVVRAAVGEVEDFARIDMLQFDEVLVASNAALDIAHLLSELMENAANFSPPDTRVEVVGHRTKAEGYVISIADHGIGMSPEQLNECNDLLARPPLVGLALSRSLGFIVVGRLAARFGIAVRLMPSPAGGTTAMVTLPSTLITDQPKSGPGAISAPGGPELPAAPDDLSGMPRAKAAPSAPEAPAAKGDVASLVAGAKAAEGATARRRQPPSGQRPGGAPPAPAGRSPRRAPGGAAPAGAPESLPTAPAAGDATPSNGAAATNGASTGGLTKRVPRKAGGERAMPGGESTRAATTTRRSPEEVRSMLSNYRSGIQRGKTAEGTNDTPEAKD